MRLYEIAIGSYLFSEVVDFDESFLALQEAVEGRVDLDESEHRQALLTWLNKWGCRQFSLNHHDHASGQIQAWYGVYAASLPAADVDLWLARDDQLNAAADAYGDLSRRVACVRANGVTATFGPVGAAKILFAIRPRLLPPWDTPIRERFGYNGSSASYLQFLKSTRVVLVELGAECEQHGFPLSELPARLERPQDTVPKLVDKFYWITITRGASLPPLSTVRQWLEWSGPAAGLVR